MAAPPRPADTGAGTYVAFRLTLPIDQEERVTACLWECGTTGMEVESEAPGQVVFLAYFPAAAGTEDELRRGLAEFPAVRLERAPVVEVDWVSRVREGFAPFDVPGFRIVPAWQSAEPARAPVIRIDPGRAFGIGTHESTRLCLAAIRRLRDRPLGRVLDLGTGTGILAIAASFSGATHAVGIDHDPDALESARLHSRLNDVEIHLIQGDLGACLAPGSFDLVTANLTAPLLLERRHQIAGLRSSRGALVLAGFLLEDLATLKDAYGCFGDLSTQAEGEWASLQVLPVP